MAKISFSARMGQRFRQLTSDYGKINQYVHETAMLIIGHAKEHGDCSTAQGLINAMPQSARKLALLTWFTNYTPIVDKDEHAAAMAIICAGNAPDVIAYLKESGATEL